MKNITNKTLGIIGIVLIILSFITSATDSNGMSLFPFLGIIVFVSSIIFIIMSASRLWKSSQDIVLGSIIFFVLSLVTEVVIAFNQSQALVILDFLIRIATFIFIVCVIIKLLKEGVVISKDPNLNLESKKENPLVIESGKESFWEKTKNFLGGGVTILIVLILIFGWFLNLVKFFKLDFREPFKAEVIRGIGLAPTPLGSILGYISIKDK